MSRNNNNLQNRLQFLKNGIHRRPLLKTLLQKQKKQESSEIKRKGNWKGCIMETLFFWIIILYILGV